MADAMRFIFDAFGKYFSVLNNIRFTNFFGFNLSFMDILIAFICVSMVITIFWRGAKG